MKLPRILKITLNIRLICIHTPPVVYEMPVANSSSSNLRAGGREKCRIVQVKPFFPLTVIGSNTSSLISIFMLRPRLIRGLTELRSGRASQNMGDWLVCLVQENLCSPGSYGKSSPCSIILIGLVAERGAQVAGRTCRKFSYDERSEIRIDEVT